MHRCHLEYWPSVREDMVDIVHHTHSYVPSISENVFVILFGGDQLTSERAYHVQMLNCSRPHLFKSYLVLFQTVRTGMPGQVSIRYILQIASSISMWLQKLLLVGDLFKKESIADKGTFMQILLNRHLPKKVKDDPSSVEVIWWHCCIGFSHRSCCSFFLEWKVNQLKTLI